MGQLRKLIRRVHPKTGEAMEEHRNQDGSLWGPGLKLYSILRPHSGRQPPTEGFYIYVPEPKPVLAQVAQGVVQAAVEARRKRILEKEMSKAPTATTRGGDVGSSYGNEAQLDTLAASPVGGNAEVVLIEQNDDGGRNKSGPSAKKDQARYAF